MDRYQETFQTWDNIASIYQEKFMDLDVYNDTYDHVCEAISKPNAKIVELGCGPGNISKYLLSKRPDFDIYGIDISPNMIELAKKNNPAARFDVMDIREIHNIKTKYDGLIAGFCLPYLSQTESAEFILKAHHLLNENSILYLSFVENDPKLSGFKAGSGGRVYFYYHTLENIHKQLTQLKFQEIETFKIRYNRSETEQEIHTVLIARKNVTQKNRGV